MMMNDNELLPMKPKTGSTGKPCARGVVQRKTGNLGHFQDQAFQTVIAHETKRVPAYVANMQRREESRNGKYHIGF